MREIQDQCHHNHPQQEHPQQQVEPFSPLFFCPPVSPRFEAIRRFALNIWAVGYYFNISHQCLLFMPRIECYFPSIEVSFTLCFEAFIWFHSTFKLISCPLFLYFGFIFDSLGWLIIASLIGLGIS
jgi:hypothetical protein